MATTIEERKAVEVLVWRRARLVRGGFPRPLAARLAEDARYDLHGLVELVESGCKPELAVRILAPADVREAG